jgi:hypothetical protein
MVPEINTTQPLPSATATYPDSECVVSVAPGFAASDELIALLTRALDENDADLAIASTFARGGRLHDPSLLARATTASLNGFLSLAAHGEVATVVGTVRVFRGRALARLLPSCSGMDLDSEIVLEALRQRLRIVEVPTTLERKPAADRYTLRALWRSAVRSWNQVRVGLRYRPALWLAVPGLIPGLLPLVVALLVIWRATPAQAALWTAITLVVQYGSLAILSWQATSFVAKRLQRRP